MHVFPHFVAALVSLDFVAVQPHHEQEGQKG